LLAVAFNDFLQGRIRDSQNDDITGNLSLSVDVPDVVDRSPARRQDLIEGGAHIATKDGDIGHDDPSP
jgi:hypothetical protein